LRLLIFTQAVYLMFSSVYAYKEIVEHLLLSADIGEGHHHGNEEVGLGMSSPIFLSSQVIMCRIEFPVSLTFITLISLINAAFL
jgi:hypothetical protein